MKNHYGYEIYDSPFFRLRTKSKLAKLLNISKSKLLELANDNNLYIQFDKEKKNGEFRKISAPRDDLKAVQKRIANLMQRIECPDYLIAPVPGRSYVDNAAVHIGSKSVRLLDIDDFYPSCTANKVFWFFHKQMECSPDVSAILKELVTYEESLPQGSPCSPILAYFSYVDMWEEIAQIVNNANFKLSVYVDDLTISGDMVTGSVIWEIKKTLRKHGHNYSIEKERSKYCNSVEITGVILRPDGRLVPPNRQFQKLHRLREEMKLDNSEDLHLMAQYSGRKSQLQQIYAGNAKQRLKSIGD